MKLYKQTNCESCLPVCLLTLINEKITKKKEDELLLNGINNFRESYALGIVEEFVKKRDVKAKVFVDNRIYKNFLDKNIKDKKISLIHENINFKFQQEIRLF